MQRFQLKHSYFDSSLLRIDALLQYSTGSLLINLVWSRRLDETAILTPSRTMQTLSELYHNAR